MIGFHGLELSFDRRHHWIQLHIMSFFFTHHDLRDHFYHPIRRVHSCMLRTPVCDLMHGIYSYCLYTVNIRIERSLSDDSSFFMEEASLS